MDDMNRSCRDFTAVLASGEPTPGGGGAAALCGAVGAALCGMVASLTTGRKRYEAVETEIQQLLKRTNALQDELLEQAAKKRGFLISGGEYDLERMAGVLLDESRGGKLGRITLEMPEADV